MQHGEHQNQFRLVEAHRVGGRPQLSRSRLSDAHLFCLRLLDRLTAEGVETRFGSEVANFETGDAPALMLASGERLQARQLLICAGPQAPRQESVEGPVRLSPIGTAARMGASNVAPDVSHNGAMQWLCVNSGCSRRANGRREAAASRPMWASRRGRCRRPT